MCTTASACANGLFGNSVHVSTKKIEVDTRLLWIYRPIKMGWLATYAARANKLARTAWAVLVKGKAFDQMKWNPVDLTTA